MRQSVFALFYIIALMGTGYAASNAFDSIKIEELHASEWYSYLLYLFLGIGVYASVCGIDLEKLKRDIPLVVQVVTLGVFLKIFIIGGILYLVTGNILSLVLAVVIAQIDPLSVSALTGKSSVLSKRARNILLVWSSFDDPVTVVVASFIGMALFSVNNIAEISGVTLVAVNFIVPLIAFLLFYLRRKGGEELDRLIAMSAFDLVLLIGIFMVSIAFGLILSLALVGLFLRPQNQKILEWMVMISYTAALFLLGTHLSIEINFFTGLLVGVAAVLSQLATSFIFTRKMEKRDTLYLGFCQQNGITTVILALLFAPHMPDIVNVTAMAILFINSFHIISMSILEYFDNKGAIAVQAHGKE